ncbi:MAG: HEAT repeat domain-containing protein [Gemmatimonas sp.]|uniref:HEAT repeat domain-containing protein n=1 Tax=Gemmatimonas sp. TaxID=1962908 RepID=UPI00391F5117
MTVSVPDAGFSPEVVSAVEDALRAFAKALRAVQLYLPNNPTRAQSVEQARQAFARVWTYLTPLDLQVREASFTLDDRVVYQDVERAGESLPWLLYRDGLRSLSFLPGFETQDLEILLALLHRARTASTDDDDLVTMLWVADVAHHTYRYVENSGASDFVMASGDRPGVATQAAGELPLAVPPAETQPPGDGPPGLVRPEDFESTRYFLDPREAAYRQDELQREYTEDQRRLVLASLLDIIELQADVGAQREALAILDQLVLEFLTLGEYDLVAYTLREAGATAARTGVHGDVQNGLRELPARLSEPQVVAQLLHTLDESARTPVASLLEGLFAELRPAALEPLVAWLGAASASPARAAIERASLRLAGANTGELAKLLEHPQEPVVRGALRLVAQLATPAAVPGLARILRGADSKLRAEAVAALADIGSPSALQALERAMDDADRDVRVAAFRGIGARKHGGALPRLLDAIRRKELRSADLGEKMVLFEAFGSLCGEQGVAVLDGILNARGLLGAKETPEMRACAARALGLVGSRTAIAALQKSADTKDVVVRSAVARAMRGGA